MNERIKNLIESLKEPSGRRGVILLLTAAGLMTEVQAEHVLIAGLAIAGAVGAFVKDRPNE